MYAPYVEHVPPDVTACIFWMKNRMPEHWRDVQNVDHVLGKYIISDRPMTEEQWIAERTKVIESKAVQQDVVQPLSDTETNTSETELSRWNNWSSLR